jgi:hypothetical protein
VKVSNIFKTRRRIAMVAVSGAMLAGAAGIAVAVFGGTGSASSHGTIGTTSLTVTPTSSNPHGGPLYPGASSSDEWLVFLAHNSSTKNEIIITETVSVNSTGGFIVTASNGIKVTGCKVTWFTATVTSTSPTNSTVPPKAFVPPWGTATIGVTLAMLTVTTTQSACEGHSPTVTLTVHVG